MNTAPGLHGDGLDYNFELYHEGVTDICSPLCIALCVCVCKYNILQ